MQQNTFNHVKTHFSETCHRIIEDHDILLVTQDDAENVVMMPQSLFDSMIKNTCTDLQQKIYIKQNEFDKNNKERIYNLMVFKGRCLSYSNDLMSNYMQFSPIIKGSNFYNSISCIIDLLLFFFINDEISACLKGRGPMNDLFTEILIGNYKKEDEKFLANAHRDIQDLFQWRTDFVIGSNFLDFTVSTFSAFEYWVSKIYDKLKSESTKDSSKVERLKKILINIIKVKKLIKR
ncbi:MAG: hypothetical protein WAX77_08890 [Methylococcaceae bacterium]